MYTDEFNTLLSNPEKFNEDTLSSLKQLVKEKPAFELGWFLLMKNLKVLNSPEFDLYLRQAAFHISDRRRLYHYLMTDEKKAGQEMKELSNEYLSSGSYQLEEKEPEDTLGSLANLAQSLRKKSRKTQLKAEGKTAAEEESPEFVTETLAKIYIRQKLYKQAILAYEKLSLKYPEKNIYFAGQIEEVKKLMN